MKVSRTALRRDLVKGAETALRKNAEHNNVNIETLAVNREQLACALCDDERAVADDDETIRLRKLEQRDATDKPNPTPTYVRVPPQSLLDALRDQRPDAIAALREELRDEPRLQAEVAKGQRGKGAGGQQDEGQGKEDNQTDGRQGRGKQKAA